MMDKLQNITLHLADRGIFLKDILEDEVEERFYLKNSVLNNLLAHKERHKAAGHGFGAIFHSVNGKMQALRVGGRHMDNLVLIQRAHGFNQGGIHGEKSPTLTSNSWEQNNLVIQLNPSKESGGTQPYQQNRVYDIQGKSPALLAEMTCGTHAILAGRVRRLTPTECARLQTIPEWYLWNPKISETQIYKMLGNGWTIEVIKHILKYLNNQTIAKITNYGFSQKSD